MLFSYWWDSKAAKKQICAMLCIMEHPPITFIPFYLYEVHHIFRCHRYYTSSDWWLHNGDEMLRSSFASCPRPHLWNRFHIFSSHQLGRTVDGWLDEVNIKRQRKQCLRFLNYYRFWTGFKLKWDYVARITFIREWVINSWNLVKNRFFKSGNPIHPGYFWSWSVSMYFCTMFF